MEENNQTKTEERNDKRTRSRLWRLVYGLVLLLGLVTVLFVLFITADEPAAKRNGGNTTGTSGEEAGSTEEASENISTEPSSEPPESTVPSESAESRKSSMNEMIHSFDVQLSQIKSLENDVARVQESSKQIEAFVDTVNKIASQTGLLAMNASIEAAHAGTLGKGFNVIAQEIRKLSEQTSSNAAQITDSLKGI